MNLTQKLKHAGLWQSLQTSVQVAAQFGYTAVMARLLSKADFGLMAIAASLIAFGIVFTEAGMGAALIQRKDVTSKHEHAAFQGSIAMGLIIFILLFLSARPLAMFFDQPALALMVKVVGVIIVLNAVSSISISLLQKKFQFKQTSLVITLTTLAGYGAGVYLGLHGWAVWSLISATALTAVLSTSVLLYLAPVKLSFAFHVKEWKELFAFSSGIILLKINNFAGGQGLNLMLGRIFPAAQLGVFERANQIKNLPGGYLGNVLDTIMFPAMTEIQDEKEKLFKVYQQALGIVNTLLIPIALFLILFAKEVVLLLLGPKWSDAVLPLQIMLIMLPFSTSGRMADSVIRARGLVYKNVKRKFLYNCVLFTSVFTGARYFGLPGAAAAVTFSCLFNYCIMLFLVQKIFDKRPVEIFLKPILAGVRLGAVTLGLTVLLMLSLHGWQGQPLAKFLLTAICVATIFAATAYKKPAMLGSYIQELLHRLWKRKNITSQIQTA